MTPDRRFIVCVAVCSMTLSLTANSLHATDSATKKEVLKSGVFQMELPLGLQADSAYIPEENPMSAEKIEVGRLLYFDPRLSKDDTVACASCHNPYHGFADPGEGSKGVDGALGGRNSPTIINRLFSKEQFWDGRAEDLEAQAQGPLTNPIEMAMPSHDAVVAKVKGIDGYLPYFKKAFGDPKVTITRIAQAIASYERTVVSGNSAYDRYQAGHRSAMSASALRGMELFNHKANCKTCHAGFNFSDESYHNIGVGMASDDPNLGRFVISKVESEKGAFKTPTLRNIAETSPYMHDGSEATLTDVLQFYNRGGIKNAWLSKEIKTLKLSDEEVQDLVAFLQSLSGEVLGAEKPDQLPQKNAKK